MLRTDEKGYKPQFKALRTISTQIYLHLQKYITNKDNGGNDCVNK